MDKIVLTNGIVGKENRILLQFPYNLTLKELVKQYPGAKWDVKLKAWAVAYTDKQLDNLLRYFKGKVWLDYSELKKVELPKPALELQNLSPWMRVSYRRSSRLWIGCATDATQNPLSKPIRVRYRHFSDF